MRAAFLQYLRRSFLVDLAGIILIALGAFATFVSLSDWLSQYDEGILLTDSNLIANGYAPHRDFYTNYPAGVPLLIAAAWKLFGVSGWITRVIGVLLHAALAIGAGRVAGQFAERRFSFFACGVVLLWTSILGPAPYAWIAALAAAFFAVAQLHSSLRKPTTLRLLLCGIAFGLVGCLRHDLFVYLCLAGGGLFVVSSLCTRILPDVRRVLWIACGAAIPLAILWLPIIARAGLRLAARDLFLDQVRYVAPARTLPFPALSFIPTDPLSIGIVIAFAAPLLGILWVTLSRRPSSAAALWTMSALSLAVLPQVIGRTDAIHVIYVAPVGLTITSSLAEWLMTLPRKVWPKIVALLILMIIAAPGRELARPFANSHVPSWRDNASPRASGLRLDDAQRRTIEFITTHTEPGERIFIGNDQHRHVTLNDVSLYYLSDRPGAARYMQFDPGIVTRLEVQQEMTAELERHRVRVIVLALYGYRFEPNESQVEGASWLDDYIKENFEEVGRADRFIWLQRRASR